MSCAVRIPYITSTGPTRWLFELATCHRFRWKTRFTRTCCTFTMSIRCQVWDWRPTLLTTQPLSSRPQQSNEKEKLVSICVCHPYSFAAKVSAGPAYVGCYFPDPGYQEISTGHVCMCQQLIWPQALSRRTFFFMIQVICLLVDLLTDTWDMLHRS